MYCRTHPTRSGVCTCSQCGDWLCEECAAEVDGRVFCKSCAQKLSPAIPGHTPCHAYTPRYISWGVLFIFSFLAPGINYMYEGLIKRGLFALSSFFLCAYLAAILNQPFFGCLIPILWITCIFDGFHIRRKINAGVTVEDSIDDVLGFLKKNKTAVILFAIFILGLSFVSALSGLVNLFFYPPLASMIKKLVPLVILVFGIYFITRSAKRKIEDCKDIRPSGRQENLEDKQNF